MAWTDAARAAAAEARRMHGRVKSSVQKSPDEVSYHAATEKKFAQRGAFSASRHRLAVAIVSMRKGAYAPSKMHAYNILSNAAMSTAVRNTLRKK